MQYLGINLEYIFISKHEKIGRNNSDAIEHIIPQLIRITKSHIRPYYLNIVV